MALTTMYDGQTNSPNTTLSAGIAIDAVTVPVDELGVFPAGPNLAVIGTGDDAETILYTDKSAATGAGNLTGVTRAFDTDGTYGVAKEWLEDEIIARNFTRYDYNTLIDNINALIDEYDVLRYKGVIDCSGNPNYPAADAGHVYLVSAAGKIGGASGPDVEASDMLVCHVDSSASGDHATVGTNWSILQKSAVDEGSILLSDVTTNDVSTTKHGFCPKRSGLSANFLDGAGTWDTVQDTDLGFNDVTTSNANTTKHGFAPKATAPAAGLLSALGIGNGETAYTCKALFDTTNPEVLGTAGPGTQVLAARRDHVHTMPTLDGVAAPTDVTTLDASTSAHGLILKATAPAAGIRNVVAIDNGETVYKNAALVDDTNPAALGTASPGTSLVAARRDHVHTLVKGGVSSWSEVTGTTQACAVNTGYILNNAALVTATLPSTAAVGDIIRLVGKGAGMWKLAQNASQYIRFAGLTTTTGTGGYLRAENAYDCIEIMCTTANNGWTVISSIGNIVVV